jgi:putative transposase
MELRKQGHCAYRCEYHLVIVSKYRRKIFNAGSFTYFGEIMQKMGDDLPEVSLLELNHDADHLASSVVDSP